MKKRRKSLAVLDLEAQHRYPRVAIAEEASGEKTMKNVIILATLVAAIAVSACRREEHHEPMKLGADVSAVEVAR